MMTIATTYLTCLRGHKTGPKAETRARERKKSADPQEQTSWFRDNRVEQQYTP